MFFSAHKIFLELCKINVEPLMSHWQVYRCPYCISGSENISVALLSMQGQRALQFHQKYLTLCSKDERRSYWFWTTLEQQWVNFLVNYPVKWINCDKRAFMIFTNVIFLVGTTWELKWYTCNLKTVLTLCSGLWH